MDRVYCVEEKPLGEIRDVAFAISEPKQDQRHIGILHRTDDAVMLLELQWHHQLCNSPSENSGFLWIAPDFPPRRLAQVSDICRKIWRANQRGEIPYGFSQPTDCFDKETCRWIIGPSGHGLTCASFVIAVFVRAGLTLIQCDTWPTSRPGDKEWQEKIVSWLTKTNASQEHVEAVRNDIGSVRYRPEEVAGAGVQRKYPVAFKDAEGMGQAIVELLRHPQAPRNVRSAIKTNRSGFFLRAMHHYLLSIWDRIRTHFR